MIKSNCFFLRLVLFFRFGKLCRCGKTSSLTVGELVTTNEDEQQNLKVKLNDEQSI